MSSEPVHKVDGYVYHLLPKNKRIAYLLDLTDFEQDQETTPALAPTLSSTLVTYSRKATHVLSKPIGIEFTSELKYPSKLAKNENIHFASELPLLKLKGVFQSTGGPSKDIQATINIDLKVFLKIRGTHTRNGSFP